MASLVYSRASLLRSTQAMLDALRAGVVGVQPKVAEHVPEERRIREYVEAPGGVSESVDSLADKLGIGRRQCRRILELMVEQGVLKRQDFVDIEPIYCRFPTRSNMAPY